MFHCKQKTIDFAGISYDFLRIILSIFDLDIENFIAIGKSRIILLDFLICGFVLNCLKKNNRK